MPSYHETRILPYTPRQMFDLVADVARYPEFLPWIAAARIRERDEKEAAVVVLLADLVVSFKLFRERFGSRVVLHEKGRQLAIDTAYIDGPFKRMESRWEFLPAPEGACEIAFSVDFEFRSRLLQGAASVFFHEAMQRVVRAFEARAGDLYSLRGTTH